MWWLKPVMGGLISAWGQSKQKAPPKYSRTADEEQMVTDLQAKVRDGFNVDERIRQQSRPLLDIAQHSKDQAYGRAISSGMQNSIITDELMRKVDRNTQERITSMSEQIAIQNQQYKDSAQSQLHSFYQSEGNAMRQSAQQQVDFKNQQYQGYASALGGMVGGLIEGSPGYQQSVASNYVNPTGQVASHLANPEAHQVWLRTQLADSNLDKKLRLQYQQILDGYLDD